jgi:hypothetical protein
MSSGPIPKPAHLRGLTPVEALKMIRARRPEAARTPIVCKPLRRLPADR